MRPYRPRVAGALATAGQQRATAVIEVCLGQRERFVDTQTGAPAHDDQPAQPVAMRAVPRRADDGGDLLNRRWVGRLAKALVARRAVGMSQAGWRRSGRHTNRAALRALFAASGATWLVPGSAGRGAFRSVPGDRSPALCPLPASTYMGECQRFLQRVYRSASAAC
jgi:hypothetical protein